jgi:hypothetical protein
LKNTFTRLIAISAAGVLSACASAPPPNIQLQADVKQNLKSIALVQVPDPDRYFLNPGQAPGGAALYMFGALGGAILGGIEASRAESATKEFTASLQPLSPAIGTRLTDELATSLSSRGYTLTRIPQLPKSADSKTIDCGEYKGRFDAVMITSLSAGYAVESQVEPRIGTDVKLLSSDCSKTLYTGSFVYTNKEFPNAVLVVRSNDAVFASRELLIANGEKAKEALQIGASELAKRIAQEL